MYIIRELEAYFDHNLTKIANSVCFESKFTTNVVKKATFQPHDPRREKISQSRPKQSFPHPYFVCPPAA